MAENYKLRKAIFSAFYNILQRNFGILITNFVMLFQAVMKFLFWLVKIKILEKW
jgi:ABC-type multidrug transport system permease subunit